MITREDVDFGEGAPAKALKKLSLDDILGLGLGSRTLRLRVPHDPGEQRATNSQSTQVAAASSNNAVVVSGTSSTSVDPASEHPKPKRRGRPPGKSTKKQKSGVQVPIANTPLSLQPGASTSNVASSPQPVLALQPNTSISGSRPATPISTTPSEQAPPSDSTPSSKRNRPLKVDGKIARFTPHEEAQREEDDAKIKAGISGVYINPTVALVPEEQQGRKVKKRMIVVFKSARLKISQWLAARKGTWKEEFAKRTQNDPSSIDHKTGANATPAREAPSLKRKSLHGNNPLHPSGDVAQPAKRIAAPPPPSNVQTQAYTPQPSPVPLQPPNKLAQSAAPYPLPGYLIPQPTYSSPYSSPYSSTVTPAPQPVLPPAPAPIYESPYQSPYQPVNPPPLPPFQAQRLQNNLGTAGSTSLHTHENGIKSESLAMPVSQVSIGTEKSGKRKAPATEGDPPGKRHKPDAVTPVQILPMPADGPSPSETTVTTPPGDALLEAILKQQEEEKLQEEQRERELQDKLSATEGLEVPEHLVRLAAEYETSVGNLLLSRDQSTLSFLSMEQPPSDKPILVVQVSTMVGNPIVSIAGSKPMELRVKCKDSSDTVIFHCFNIGLTEAARKAADVMRAKLVLAKINIRGTAAEESPDVSEDEQDEAELAVTKPFLCEECGKRFKNKEGIIYHRTKSQTSCNPNFDLSSKRPRTWARGPRKKKVKIVKPKPKPEGRLEERKDSEDGEAESDSSDSLGSIIEWAEKASRPNRRYTSSRRRRGESNPSDEERAPASVHSNDWHSEHASVASSDEEDESMDDGAYLPMEEKSPRKRGSAMQERWARVKAVGGNKLAGDADIENLHHQLYRPSARPHALAHASPSATPKRIRMPVTEEERERRAGIAARKQHCWETAPAFLPNIETSAWDQIPFRVKKLHRRPIRRHELPEPITYMQADGGAWSIRPFGHGVKPIYARPSRRADGNPNLPQYLKRIENGFRPVIMPTKNRLFLPATPTKRLLEDPTSYTPPSSVNGLGASDKPTSRGRAGRGASVTSMGKEEDANSDVRISKITGRPVRSYRKGPEPIAQELISRVDDSVSQRAQNSLDLDQIHVLNSLEPKKVDPAKGRVSNPGLNSLPTSFGLGLSQISEEQVSTTGDGESNRHLREEIPATFSLSEILLSTATETQPRVLSDIDQVAAWEQGRGSELLCSGSLQPDYRWANHRIESLEGAANLQNVKLTWDHARSFDMLTLPYAELDELENSSLFDATPAPQYRAPRSSLKPASRNARDLRELHQGWTTRRLTALESDLAGLGAPPEKVAREMGAQIAFPATMVRNRHGDSNMSAAEDARFIVGVCVIRGLTGGLDQNIDWVLVSTLFGNFSINFLTKHWTALFQKRRVVIEKLMFDFQEAFLPAYRNGEVPPLDYDNLVAYDWNRLVNWVMKKVDVTLDSKAIVLPDTRERLDKLYHVKEQNVDNSRQEGYFSLTYPVYKRMELASSTANANPAIKPHEAKCADDIKIDTFTLVKSWVRAGALTPDEIWNPQIMKRMFKSLNDPRREDKRGNDPVVKKLVEDAANALKNEKVLMQKNKGRATPDRSYEPTDVFFGGLRKHVTVQQFVEAAHFKHYLDQEFARGVPYVRSDYLANEGTLMCVTHLQAHGRIRLRPVGVPLNKFGLGDGSYETRKIPKERFRFDMDIYPTATYVHDADNEVLQRLRRTEPPRGSNLGELPIWYGVGDRLIVSLWHKVLVGFAGIVALRAGSAVEGLRKIFKPTLEEWEIWRLLEWGVEHGVFERLHEMVGGWTTAEWWWLVVGWCCSGGS